MKRKEIIWLIGTILFILIFNFSILGKDSLNWDSAIDINIHDTYFVIAKTHLFILFSVLIFFGSYLIRILRQNFKNKITNLIFLVANILVVFIFTKLISVSNSFSQISGTSEASKIIKDNSNIFTISSNILMIIQVLLLVLIAFFGIKTGMNYKNK